MDARALAQDIARELQDLDGIRWPAPVLVGYLNDAQRFIVNRSASATAQEVELVLAAGVRQEIPAGARSLLEVIRNTGGRQKAVTQVARGALNASAPGWASGRPRNAISHFMTDARTPRLFDVYPPAAAGVKVLAMLAMEPVDLALPAGTSPNDVTGQLQLAPEYREAVRHYALFRAWSVDGEHAGNASLAAAHRALCLEALGIDTGHPSTADDPTN